MNFYPFHIGDYVSATRHLSWDEDIAYRRLIDAYYTREEPLPLDSRQVYRLVCATTETQREAIDIVLDEFFERTDDGWRNSRCDTVIYEFQLKREKAAQSAHARWRNPNAKRTESDRNANASEEVCERIENPCEGNATNTNTNTNTNTKVKTNNRFDPISHLVSLGVDNQVATDYCQQRKKKPNLTALQGIEHQAAKAGMSLEKALRICCSRGWEGFKADWVKDKPVAATGRPMSASEKFYEAINKKPMKEVEDGYVIDVTPRLG